MTDWNDLIRDVVAGRWADPDTGKRATVPFETIELVEDLDGGEADMLAPLKLGRRLAVVSDSNTLEAMGRRVARHLKALGTIEEIVLPSDIACDEPTIALVQEKTRHADAVVAVGSGVLSDTCKYATFKDGRPYVTFGTAASMNGYAASTASVTLANGYKTSLPAQAPRGIFIDLKVSAAAPTWLSAAGLGDSLCRSTAQIDWWASHRLFGTFYSPVPYRLIAAAEAEMIKSGADLARHSVEANGHLHRVLRRRRDEVVGRAARWRHGRHVDRSPRTKNFRIRAARPTQPAATPLPTTQRTSNTSAAMNSAAPMSPATTRWTGLSFSASCS